jgi:osmotically-inducible protein OsmY
MPNRKLAILLAAALVLGGGIAQADTVGQNMDDAAITASVKSKLIGDGDTPAYKIDVDTKAGVVQLNGTVESQAARAEAERIARETKGVASVKNNLQVKPNS